LGGNVVAVGVIGDDWNGRKLTELLKQDNVDTECIIARKKWQTTVKTRIIAEQQQIVRIDREKRVDLKDEDTKAILDFLNKKIDDVDSILISDYDKGLVTNSLLEYLIPLAKKIGKPVVVHPKVVHFLDYKGVTIVNSNIERASIVTGIHQVNETSIRNMGQWLLTQLECEYVLITCGNDGMSLFGKNGGVTQIPAVTEKLYNVTGVGAGDTVTSLIALSLASGVTNMVNPAILANIAAGVVVEKLGTTTLTRDELKDRLNTLKGEQLAFGKNSE
jgi:D-beta-D-heptose 7-phosphate kinase/D-beta-D-heptose 1-phosphate adenosyltransferase